MTYPNITINTSTYAQITQNKTGDLAMVYKPLQNLIINNTLGGFTTEKLEFDRYTPQDLTIVDEFDGSTNIILNDDKNQPKLINSGFSVQEDNTFLIPEHYTHNVENIYSNSELEYDTSLLKLYKTIPTLDFEGLADGGFKCGSYIFYFRLADSHGNMSNVIQHSSVVQIHVGEVGSYKVRMGMQDEIAGKSVKFKLSNLDGGFDYVRVFYERTSTANDQAQTTLFYMINQNFPIINGTCDLLLTGEQEELGISLSDLKNEYADIMSCKTQAVVDNTLFLANTSGYVNNYKMMQQMAWTIFAEQGESTIDLPNTKAEGEAKGYYNTKNIYYNVGYWPDEYYRFGIVFIYHNNQLSPVFNIQGCDLSKEGANDHSLLWNRKIIGNLGKFEFFDTEPDNYIFNADIMSNSRGVVKLKPQTESVNPSQACNTYIKFHTEGLANYINYTQHLREGEKKPYRHQDDLGNEYIDVASFMSRHLGIKGFFFVRQKRIPTCLAQGMVVGLTKKDHGCIPVLQDGSVWKTKSFIGSDRILHDEGPTLSVPKNNALPKALLVPDAELQEATFNQIFTSQEFTLQPVRKLSFSISNDGNWWEYEGYNTPSSQDSMLAKLTAVPKDTKLKTNGTDYFSTIVGSAEESFKTEDVVNVWNKTAPQDLTKSTSLIRGRWGYFVGMNIESLEFGDLVTIKKAGFYKDPENQNLLEFQQRFNDYSFYSPISPRKNISELPSMKIASERSDITLPNIFCYTESCYNGDCFPSMFTHRMMTNFIDPELPTNTKIVDRGCWAKNYAVRCTAEILADTHSNLTSDSAGFYIPSPVQKTSNIVSLIFGILTGNLGIVIQSAKKLIGSDPLNPPQSEFANEIAQAFEVYIGAERDSASPNDPIVDGGYENYEGDGKDGGWERVIAEGKIKKVNPKEQEQNASGFNLKAIFKSDDKWELHGVAQINRADVNAVSFGQWITFPFYSSMNVAFRDVDFNNTTEEAKFNQKRSFYPLEDMAIKNKLPESNVINGATKKTIHKNSYPAYRTVPFMKQEYFNRIYWSKPTVTESFLNSFRLIYSDQYKEYNKELGTITKILPMSNSLFICFTHGMGIVPVDRSIKNEIEASPYLASRNVLPAQVSELSKDFGSMWKDSVIKTPRGLIYGVDTVAKKIWRTDGQKIEFISDHIINKFLNDWIALSEFDFQEYQGHMNVKTHYNNFKNDVIFTFIKDIPKYTIGTKTEQALVEYLENFLHISLLSNKLQIDLPSGDIPGKITYQGYQESDPIEFEIQEGKIYINDMFTGIWMDVDSWEKGVVWSLCYNEVLNKFITFYDWYPIESCNVDNIFFSFNQDAVDAVYDQRLKEVWKIEYVEVPVPASTSNKYFIDGAFQERIQIYRLDSDQSFDINEGKDLISLYYKGTLNTSATLRHSLAMKEGWTFAIYEIPENKEFKITVNKDSSVDIAQLKAFSLPEGKTWDVYSKSQENEPRHLKYYDIREYNPSRMYLWKHGMAGLYDNEGKIRPAHWYGNQHEFNFEFVVNDTPTRQKIFNNLKLLSNKAAPSKFEYEVVGEGYEWFEYKPIVEWINKQVIPDGESENYWWLQVLGNKSGDVEDMYPEFPGLFDRERTIHKLPYLKMKHTDKKGTPERPHYKWDNGKDYWADLPHKDLNHDDKYSYNCSEPCLVEDDQLNEVRLRTESLGNDMRKYGRIRGNMQYLEDLWNVEIRPVQITWCYLDSKDELQTKTITETRHRDKYLKVKVRYSGEDLALIQAIYTIFDESYT